MEGVLDPLEQRGIIPRSFDHIFGTIAHSSRSDVQVRRGDGSPPQQPPHASLVPAAPQYLVRASYLELYNEALHDLLGGKGGRGGGGGGKSSAAAAKRRWQPLELRESPDSGVFVKDLTSTVVQNAKELRVRRRVTERAHTLHSRNPCPFVFVACGRR